MKEIEAGIAHFRPEMLITVGIDKPMFDPSLDVLPELCEKYSLYHIYWATEDKIHFEGISLPYVRRVKPDMVLTIHPDCVKNYRSMGIESEYLNFAFNPRLFPPKTMKTEEIYEIAFVGTTHLETKTYRYDSLKQLLFPLLQMDVRVDVWGHNWMESKDFLEKEFNASITPSAAHGFLPYKHTVAVYHQSKIMLGIQNARDQVTQRTFEILGSGSLMLASRTEELERLFEHEEEIILSSSPEETIEYARYYLKHPEERMRIGLKARKKILAEHTFERHLNRIWPFIYESFRGKRRETHDRISSFGASISINKA
nr:glycosyltransferase [Paenibacillus sp. 32O-W]